MTFDALLVQDRTILHRDDKADHGTEPAAGPVAGSAGQTKGGAVPAAAVASQRTSCADAVSQRTDGAAAVVATGGSDRTMGVFDFDCGNSIGLGCHTGDRTAAVGAHRDAAGVGRTAGAGSGYVSVGEARVEYRLVVDKESGLRSRYWC